MFLPPRKGEDSTADASSERNEFPSPPPSHSHTRRRIVNPPPPGGGDSHLHGSYYGTGFMRYDVNAGWVFFCR